MHTTGASVHQTSHQLMREALREALVDALRLPLHAATDISSGVGGRGLPACDLPLTAVEVSVPGLIRPGFGGDIAVVASLTPAERPRHSHRVAGALTVPTWPTGGVTP